MVTIPHYKAVITPEDYVVAGFQPQLRSPAFANTQSFATAGTADITDQLADALDVDMGSDCRWIADPAKLVDHGDGTWRWNDSVHNTGFGSSYWEFAAANMPVVDTDYDYLRHNKREVTKPAFVFKGEMWGRLRGWPSDPSPAWTVLMAARLRRTNGAHRAGVIESRRSGTDEEDSSDVALRMRGHRLRTVINGHYRENLIVNTRRPHIVGCTHGARYSKLVVVTNTRHVKEFKHPEVDNYDMTFFLGRMGGQYDPEQTMVMDVFEINLWDNKLGDRPLRRAIHKLNHIYGVTD